MRQEPGDPLELWRGIDDAIWREATRALAVQPLTRQRPMVPSHGVAPAPRETVAPELQHA
jgi:hypothetical protein